METDKTEISDIIAQATRIEKDNPKIANRLYAIFNATQSGQTTTYEDYTLKSAYFVVREYRLMRDGLGEQTGDLC